MENSDTEGLFTDYHLSKQVLDALKEKGFVHPTKIQETVIPRLMDESVNIAVKARTGTGKTAAFGIPLVNRLTEKSKLPQALILAPTRELALQISVEITSLTKGKYPRITAVYGGAAIGPQLRALEKGSEIVVGTPGRIQDHIERGSLDLSDIKWLILDEADEMLDMGFIDDVKAIIEHTNRDKKTALFSATMPPAIMKIINEHLENSEIITEDVPDREEILVNQNAVILYPEDRLEALKRIIDSTDNFHGLVFCPTKIEADKVSRILTEEGYPSEALHGNLSQEARERTLRRFRNKITTILIATDVAARGIDVERLTHVINWDLPRNFDSYVHRIGRTGRAGEKGTAVSFISPSLKFKLKEYTRKSESFLGNTIDIVQVPEVGSIVKVRCERLKKRIAEVAEEYEKEISKNGADSEASLFADKLISAFGAERTVTSLLMTAYGNIFDTARYREIKKIENAEKSKRKGNGKKKSDIHDGRKSLRIHMDIGREQGAGPRDIIKFLKKLLKINGSDIDDIAVKGTFSFATVPEEAGYAAVKKSKRDPSLPLITLARKEKEEKKGGKKSNKKKNGRDRHVSELKKKNKEKK